MGLKIAAALLLFCICILPAVAQVGAAPSTNQAETPTAELYRKCPQNGGYGQTISIIPRVYISYTGQSDCWSEIRSVQIPIDFLKLRESARVAGDSHTRKFMSNDYLVEFFTWLLESGRFAMPGDALNGILGYGQRGDYQGLYEMFKSFAASRR